MFLKRERVAILAAVALCLFTLRPAHAVELLIAEAERADGRYGAHVEMRVMASAEQVRASLTDYDHLDRLNDAVIKSTLLERIDPSRVRVRIQVRTCFLFVICFTKTQVHEGVEGPQVIRSTILPEVSDFKSGWARWEIISEGGVARVRFDTEMEPDFWIPPLIGPEIVKNTLVDEAIETMETIEALAGAAQGSRSAQPEAPQR